MFIFFGLMMISLAVTVHSAEISSSYAMLEKHAVQNQALKPEQNSDDKPDVHQVSDAEYLKHQGKARIEPVTPIGPVIKHENMLADQPITTTTGNRISALDMTGNGYQPDIAQVAYPDIQYAPGYFYDNGYSVLNNNDMYGLNPYLVGPDPFSLLQSHQVPNSRTLVSYIGSTIIGILNSVFTLFLGALLAVSICSYTNLCSISFHGVGPIHEEMRSNQFRNEANFVKTAVEKYQKIQKVTDEMSRRRRAIFS